MPAVVARLAWFSTILVFVAASGHASGDPLEGRAEFTYLHGFEASGGIEGTCQAAGFRFDTHTPGSVEVPAQAFALVLLETWRNSTILEVDGLYRHEALVEATRSVTTVPVEEGPLRLEWPAGAHLYLTQDHHDHGAPSETEKPLTTQLSATRLTSTTPQRAHTAGPGYYYVEREDLLWRLQSGISGPSRWVQTNQDEVRISGDGFFLMDGLKINGPGFELDLPEYRQHERIAETPGSYISSILHTHAILQVRGIDLQIGTDQGDLACGAMHWSAEGSVTYRQSTGAVIQGENTATFRNQQFSLEGGFSSEETIIGETQPWGQRYEVEAVAEGLFVSGADYRLLTESGHEGWSLPAKVTGAAAILGLLAAMWRFGPYLVSILFTRVAKEEALDHPLRAALETSAREAPGTPFAHILDETGTSYSTIRHHALLMQKLGLISLHRIGREVCLFPPGTPRSRAMRHVALRKAPVRYLVENVKQERRLMKAVRAQLQQEFERGPSWATRVVAEAEKCGLVVRERTNDGVVLCVKEP